MRSPLWYVIAIAIGFGITVSAYFYARESVIELDQQVKAFRVNGSVSIQLEKTGKYTIFYEEHIMPRGPDYRRPTLSLQLYEGSSGHPIVLETPPLERSYNIFGRMGTSVADFTIVRPGYYRLASNPVYGQPATLAIAQGAIGGLFEIALTTIGIAFAGIGVAGVIVVITLMQRNVAKRAKAT
jgi:hypothetical protein